MLHETRPDDRRSVEQQQVMHSWGRVVAQIDEALFSVDRTWRFVSVNERLASIWGRSEEELLGKVMWSEFPSLRGSPFEELLSKGRPREERLLRLSHEGYVRRN